MEINKCSTTSRKASQQISYKIFLTFLKYETSLYQYLPFAHLFHNKKIYTSSCVLIP